MDCRKERRVMKDNEKWKEGFKESRKYIDSIEEDA